jgi:hypothetical protein
MEVGMAKKPDRTAAPKPRLVEIILDEAKWSRPWVASG